MDKADKNADRGKIHDLIDEPDSLKEQLDTEQSELSKYKSLAQEYLDTARRVQAEFENYKKRIVREREEMLRYANECLLADILNIYDDLQRALEADCTAKEFRSGVSKIHDNLTALLRENNVREISADGKFDPTCHEALAVGDGEDGSILEIYQKGYYLGTRVLRTSKVKVARSTGDNND
ncbi:MAG: nucleotide exchange factor GrpE [Euryarchaeota archaeon]|nr:nucleotide exchange factor GrpE [Euryarchaeota archaeon]